MSGESPTQVSDSAAGDTTQESFDPSAHPLLADLGERLRELAGDSAYVAGRDYLRKGLVRDKTVAGTSAYATVSGSTDYRVSIAFGQALKPGCTCPAYRRRPYCKHVVCLCTALLEHPSDFRAVAPSPEAPSKTADKGKKRATGEGEKRASKAETRAAGLQTVDRLLTDLADGGLMGVSRDTTALLEGAAEFVRSQKLRRLGNLLLTLKRLIESGAGEEDAMFAVLLSELYLARQATRAYLAGEPGIDPLLAEEIAGTTWRAEQLEPVAGLELMELTRTSEDNGEFIIDRAYFIDLDTATCYVETRITPRRMRKMRDAARPCGHTTLVVDEAGLYPGPAPRRIRLARTRRAPLRSERIRPLLAMIPDDVGELRLRLIEHLRHPFSNDDLFVAFRPAAILELGKDFGAVDGGGRFIHIDGVDQRGSQLPADHPGEHGLAGPLTLDRGGMRLRFGGAICPGHDA